MGGKTGSMERCLLTLAVFYILIGSSEASTPHSVTPTTEEKAGMPAVGRIQ